jgi:hypothetical protein
MVLERFPNMSRNVDEIIHGAPSCSGAAVEFLTYSLPDGYGPQVATPRVANDAGEQSRPPTASAITHSTLPRDQLLEEVQRWLSPSDPTSNYNVAREARLEGTVQWFLQGSTFKSWKSTGSLLWIHGKRSFVFLPLRFGC